MKRIIYLSFFLVLILSLNSPIPLTAAISEDLIEDQFSQILYLQVSDAEQRINTANDIKNFVKKNKKELLSIAESNNEEIGDMASILLGIGNQKSRHTINKIKKILKRRDDDEILTGALLAVKYLKNKKLINHIKDFLMEPSSLPTEITAAETIATVLNSTGKVAKIYDEILAKLDNQTKPIYNAYKFRTLSVKIFALTIKTAKGSGSSNVVNELLDKNQFQYSVKPIILLCGAYGMKLDDTTKKRFIKECLSKWKYISFPIPAGDFDYKFLLSQIKELNLFTELLEKSTACRTNAADEYLSFIYNGILDESLINNVNKYRALKALSNLLNNKKIVSIKENGNLLKITKAQVATKLMEKLSGMDFKGNLDKLNEWWGAFESTLFASAVNNAIRKGVEFLKTKQASNGAFPSKKYVNYDIGITSLTLYTLLKSGCLTSDEEVAKCIDFLVNADFKKTVAKTYEVSLYIIALSTYIDHLDDVRGTKMKAPPKLKKKLQDAVDFLISMENPANKGWHYGPPPTDESYDNSNTQYVVLALHAAAQVDADIPQKIWQDLYDHFVNDQTYSGGWPYRYSNEKSPTTLSMTSAGYGSFIMITDNLKKKDPTKIEQVLFNGKKRLEVEYNGGLAISSPYVYYALERACMLGNIKYLKSKDWYKTGAEIIIKNQIDDGSWNDTYDEIIDSCFYLLFLKRAFIPVASQSSH